MAVEMFNLFLFSGKTKILRLFWMAFFFPFLVRLDHASL